ncbi:MAG: hypothetical protein VX438_13660 [Planctomycetota bacterium]|nr:hypothetical protein [Planctomycetota bacterium]
MDIPRSKLSWPIIFYWVQAFAISGWWLGMTLFPLSRALFFKQGFEVQSFWIFLGPDCILLVGLSLGLGMGNWHERGRFWVSGLLVGATAYATLVTWGMWCLNLATALSSLLMTILLLANCGILDWRFSRGSRPDQKPRKPV